MQIQDLIIQNLDVLLAAQNEKGNLTIDAVIEIGAYVAGGVLRGRFSSEKEVNKEEVKGVFGIIGNFYRQNFGDAFTQEDFDAMSKQALEFLQSPTFDDDLENFKASLLGK